MVHPGHVKRVSQALAACFLLPLVIAVLAGVFVAIFPVDTIPIRGEWLPDGAVTLEMPYTVFLPLALAATVVLRGTITRTPADIMLATFAVPCLLVVLWALSTPNSGVYWGAFLTVASATLLALVVLADAVLDHRISRTSPRNSTQA